MPRFIIHVSLVQCPVLAYETSFGSDKVWVITTFYVRGSTSTVINNNNNTPNFSFCESKAQGASNFYTDDAKENSITEIRKDMARYATLDYTGGAIRFCKAHAVHKYARQK